MSFINKAKSKLGRAGIWAIALVLTIMLASLFASLIQNDFTKVSVKKKYFMRVTIK